MSDDDDFIDVDEHYDDNDDDYDDDIDDDIDAAELEKDEPMVQSLVDQGRHRQQLVAEAQAFRQAQRDDDGQLQPMDVDAIPVSIEVVDEEDVREQPPPPTTRRPLEQVRTSGTIIFELTASICKGQRSEGRGRQHGEEASRSVQLTTRGKGVYTV